MRKTIAIILMVSLCLGLCACGGSKECRAVKEKINAIGTVSLDSEEAILAAERAYNELSEEDKEDLANSVATLVLARMEYDALVNEMQKQKAKKDSQDRVDKVISQIDAITEVSLASQNAIQDATLAYQSLQEDERALVLNYDKLTEATKQLETVKAEAIETAIEAHKSNFNVKTDNIDKYTYCAHKNFPQYINIRSYIGAIVVVQDNKVQLGIFYNYTDDNWIFFDKLTIVVDGQQYEKTAKNPSRQVAWGSVVERYVEELPFDLPVDSEEIELLKAIANSNETIIRFRGSDGTYDLLVKQQDKDAIKDTLALYEAMVG